MWIGTTCRIVMDDGTLSIAGLTVFSSTGSGNNGIFQFTVNGSNYTYTAKNICGYTLYNKEKGMTWPAGQSYTFGHTSSTYLGNWYLTN